MKAELRRVLTRAKKSEFYRSHLPKRIVSWEEVPLTTKEHLRKAYPFGLRAVEKNKIVSFHESSGTEGKPISSYFTENDWNDIASRFARSAVNLNARDTFFIKTPYSMVTTAHQAHCAANLMGAMVVPGDNRSSNMPYSRVVQILKDLEVTVSWSLPTETLLWASTAESYGHDIKKDFPSLRAFWVAGEPLSSGRKRAIEKIWGDKKVFQDYGSTETGSLAGECTHGKLHAWSDRVLFEVQKDDGTFSTTGKGELVVTPYFREAMPLVRYQMGDRVEIKTEPCTCGSLLPQIAVLGRLSSRICVKEMTLYPNELENTVYEAGLAFGLKYYRVYYDENSLEINFSSETPKLAEASLKEAFLKKYNLEIKAMNLPEQSFVPAFLLKQKLNFSKPQFLFPKGKYQGRALAYY